jgi:hypothetical protein
VVDDLPRRTRKKHTGWHLDAPLCALVSLVEKGFNG